MFLLTSSFRLITLGVPSEIRDAVDGQWKIVNGFNKMKYDLILTDEKINIDPRTVKSVVFDMVVAGDYNIAVIGFSEANRAAEMPDLQEWIKTTDGRIQMPYRDVIQAPGNYGQSPDYTKNRKKLVDNPDAMESGRETSESPISLWCRTRSNALWT